MASEPQTRKHQVEREFGFIVGGVFIALAGWWLVRGKFHLIAPGSLVVGIVLVLLAVLFPRALVVPNRLWMMLADVLSFVMTRVILGIVFFAVVTPIGILRRLFGADPLRRRAARSESYWVPYPAPQSDPRHYEKMY